MKKNFIGSCFINRIILGATLISIVGSTLAVTDHHQSHGSSFIRQMQKHFEILKDDWKCLLDRKKRCTLIQKSRITAELIILATLIAPILYAGVQWQQWRRKEAQAEAIEKETRAKEEPLKRSVKELEGALLRGDKDAISRLLAGDNRQEIIDKTLIDFSRSADSLSLLTVETCNRNKAVQSLITHYHPSKKAMGTALIAIVRGDALNLVKLLLQQGLDSEDINRALFEASGSASNNNLGIVRELINQGRASVSYRAPYGNTPLHAAVNKRNWPTHKALINRRKAIITDLLLRGANPYAANNQGLTPLAIASPAEKELIDNEISRRDASALLRGVGPIKQGEAGQRPLAPEEIHLIVRKLPGGKSPTPPPSEEEILERLPGPR